MAQYVGKCDTFVCRVQCCVDAYYYAHTLVVVPRDVRLVQTDDHQPVTPLKCKDGRLRL